MSDTGRPDDADDGGGLVDRPAGEAGSSSSEVGSAAAEEELGPFAQEFLRRLLDNIRTMLTYVNETGITMPADLRVRLDELMTNPTLDKYCGQISIRPPASQGDTVSDRRRWLPW